MLNTFNGNKGDAITLIRDVIRHIVEDQRRYFEAQIKGLIYLFRYGQLIISFYENHRQILRLNFL